MASYGKDLLGAKGKHTVGQVESWKMDTVINGAIVEEDVDNFVLGELVFKKEGDTEVYVKPATNKVTAENAVLVCTPEVRLAGEPLCNFYNKKGEKATCAILKPNFQFSTSKINSESLEDLAIGDKMEFKDGEFKKVAGAVPVAVKAKKKKVATAEVEPEPEPEVQATASKLFRVVEIEKDARYTIDGQTLVSLNVIK